MNEKVTKNWLYPDMPDTVRHINMGIVSPALWTAIWEYSRGYSGEIKPALFSFMLNRDCLLVPPPCPFEDLVNMDELPEDMYLTRLLNIRKFAKGSGVYLYNRDVLLFYLHLPSSIKHSFADKGLKFSMIDLLQDRGLPCSTRGNDCYVLVDDKKKKFTASMIQTWPSGWTSYEHVVTLSIDTKLLDKLLKMDVLLSLKGKKPQKKFGNFVGGLDELDSTIGADTVIEPFIKNLSRRLGANIVKSELDEEEIQYLDELATALDQPSWRIHCIHPDLGDLK